MPNRIAANEKNTSMQDWRDALLPDRAGMTIEPVQRLLMLCFGLWHWWQDAEYDLPHSLHCCILELLTITPYM